MELLYVWIDSSEFMAKNQVLKLTNDFEISQIKKNNDIEVFIKPVKRFNLYEKNKIKDIFAIIGENGTGKTTLIKTILSHNFKGFSIFNDNGNFVIYSSADEEILCSNSVIRKFKANFTKHRLSGLNNEELYGKRSLVLFYDNIFDCFNNYKIINRTLYQQNKCFTNMPFWFENNISTSYEYFFSHKENKANYVSNEVKNNLSLFESEILNKINIVNPKILYIKNITKDSISFSKNSHKYKRFNFLFFR